MCPPSPMPILTGRVDSNDSNNGNSDNNNFDNHNNDDDNYDSDDADNKDLVAVGRIEAKDWNQINDGSRVTRRNTHPMPYTLRNGDGELFHVKILKEDLKKLYDENHNLRYYKVHE